MAAQEAIHGLHNPPYAKNEPGSNGYDYNYSINNGSYPNHYNPYMHYGEPQHSYEHLAAAHHHYAPPPPHQNGPGPESHHAHHYPQPPIPNNHLNHHLPHHYGHGMDGGMSLNPPPPSHYNMMPGSNHSGVYKEEPKHGDQDPYSFVDEESGANKSAAPTPVDTIKAEPAAPSAPVPKKRGRKKKIKPEPEAGEPPMTMDILSAGVDAADGQPTKRKYTKSEHYKQRRRHDRFNGMTEEEVRSRTLPDHLASNLDVVIIGINPGLFAAYKGHHYAGPGNHFWKCLYLAGLVPEPMTADDDFKLVHFGIGFTNMVARPTKGSADLTRKEIREGGRILLEKLQQYRPKIAVFNGKGIYEVFSGKKEFTFGKQPECIDGTNTFIWVMPSSSARCAQLPRAMDKVPFYSALKKFRDYLNGLIPEIDENEVIFNDPKIRAADDGTEISEHLKVDSLSSDDVPALVGSSELPSDDRQQQQPQSLPPPVDSGVINPEVPVKKKRGRPKKIRPDGVTPVKPAAQPSAQASSSTAVLGANGELVNGQPPKKKRGRPKKIRPEEVRPQPPVDSGANNSFSANNTSNQSQQQQQHVENRGPTTSSASPAPSYMGQSFVTNQPSVINHPPSQQQQHLHNIDYYSRLSANGGGGPLSGLCNDISPQQSTSSTPQPTTASPRQAEFDPGKREGPSTQGSINGGQMEHRATPGEEARHQLTSPGSSKPHERHQQQQHQQQPPRSHPSTPQPMAYRPTPPAVGAPYHVTNQDVASNSLSGLESLVDQIPSMSEGEQQQQHHHHHLQNGLQPVSVPSSFSQYTTAQPTYSYPSTSFAHYPPHYTAPTGGAFPPNPYHPGAQESVYSRAAGSAYPMTFPGPGAPTPQLNGRGPPVMPSFPYTSYGQAYPPPPPPSGTPGFHPYPPSGAMGFHPSTSYAYSTTANGTYAPSYTTQAAGYLNANQDRPKDERTDTFGGYH